MKLTKTQGNELLKQHPGTGYVVINKGYKTYSVIPIHLSRKNEWRAGDRLLDEALKEHAQEIEA